MKTFIAAIVLALTATPAFAVQYCQEVGQANLDYIAQVVTYVNERDGTSLTVEQFLSETIKKRVEGELVRKINDEARAEFDESAKTAAEIASEAEAALELQQAAINENW